MLHAAYAWRYWGSPFSLAQPVGVGNFTGDPVQGLAGLLVSPSRGLFVFSPVFLFAIPAAVNCFRRGGDERAPLLRALTLGTVLTIAAYSFWHSWWGGHSFGYRLLTELALPLTILVACDWRRIGSSRAARWLLGAAIAASVLVHALGAFQYPTAFNADVDREPLMLWNISDTELALRARRVFGPIPSRDDAGLAPWLRPAPPPPSKVVERGDRRRDPAARARLAAGPSDRAGPSGRHRLGEASFDDPGEVLISINPGERRMIADRFPRPDVAAAAASLGDASTAGFGKRLPPPARLESASVLVEVRDRHGNVARMGPVQFLWGPATPARQ
jgi:hypothetical protein